MPTTTGYELGNVVLVPFTFTDQRTTKRWPAVVVGSERYYSERSDLIILAVTGEVRAAPGAGEAVIGTWKEAGPLKPSVREPLIATIEKWLVLRRIERFEVRIGKRCARCSTTSSGNDLKAAVHVAFCLAASSPAEVLLNQHTSPMFGS